MKTMKLVILFVPFLLLPSCLKTYQGLNINDDLSGTVFFKVSYDMENLLESIASIQGGGIADPELTKMLKETLRTQVESKMKLPSKEELQERLPEGVTLVKLESVEKGSVREVNIEFAFDDITRFKNFKEVKLFKNMPKEMGGIPIPVEDPLQQIKELVIEQKGEYLTISQKVGSIEILQNKEMMDSVPGGEQMLDSLLKSVGFYFRIKHPSKKYTLVEHSALEYKNHTLYWPYNSKKITEFVKEGKTPKPIYVKLKKK